MKLLLVVFVVHGNGRLGQSDTVCLRAFELSGSLGELAPQSADYVAWILIEECLREQPLLDELSDVLLVVVVDLQARLPLGLLDDVDVP